ncbi:MAG TPA: hypothetical protein P5530_01355 [Candidatus Diapherotrites archaeon]|nr:hypothetical protein [Candidatus Diapherotrites archaeon]
MLQKFLDFKKYPQYSKMILEKYIKPKLGYQEYYLAKEHAKMGPEVTVITSDRYAPCLFITYFSILNI